MKRGRLDTPYSIPEQEPPLNKSLTIMNNTNHIIRVLRLGSDWKTVNFAIESEDTPTRDRLSQKKSREMAELYPHDKIELTFQPPQRIEP